jgi:hypothetical protein
MNKIRMPKIGDHQVSEDSYLQYVYECAKTHPKVMFSQLQGARYLFQSFLFTGKSLYYGTAKPNFIITSHYIT